MDRLLFAPESEMWRINRERCGLLFGPAAAVLQVAHPRVAQGVHDHSNFRTDTLGRLRRTLQGTNRIAFGTVSQAEAMKAHLAVVHGRVRGQVAKGVGGPKVYSAFEPALLVWVLATLIAAAVQGYEFIYGKLPLARKEGFYRDMCRFGTYFGVEEADCPRDWEAFAVYYDGMVKGTLLGSHSICSELAHSVIHPRDSRGIRWLGSVLDFLPVETLPPLVRARLGLRSTASTRLRFRVAQIVLPSLFPRLPRRVRFYQEYLATLDP